jgi:signal transduction histidine kinase
MLQSEKMAALGQLISGIAHEINTPLGAIRASIGNIEIYLKNTITYKIPQLLKCTDESQQNMFFHMLSESVNNKQTNSSRDERAYKKALSLELKEMNINNARNIADMIISMGLYKSYKNYIPLFKHRESLLIIQTCYELSDILRNGENINSAIEKVSKIIYALKNYSHFDYSGTAVETDVISGIENVLALFAHNFKQGVEIIKNYGPIPLVICYPDELNQVWTNLISNALHAMDYSGTMEIETFVEGNYACIRVTDSGSGIPNEIKERIFEPFFTTKKQGEGTGIGLEIVRKIVDKHQGIIEVQSIPGRTSFTVKLPIVQG